MLLLFLWNVYCDKNHLTRSFCHCTLMYIFIFLWNNGALIGWKMQIFLFWATIYYTVTCTVCIHWHSCICPVLHWDKCVILHSIWRGKSEIPTPTSQFKMSAASVNRRKTLDFVICAPLINHKQQTDQIRVLVNVLQRCV